MTDIDENKVVLIGDPGVGKTCIMKKFMEGEFDEDTFTTVTAQYHRKHFKFPGNKSISLNIWDTAGQEKFRSINNIYYKKARAVIMVYDITVIKSFNSVKEFWYNQIKENAPKDIFIVVAANKCDLYEERQVPDKDGEGFAKSIGAIFEKTSAKNDSGITNLFENIAKKLLDPGFKTEGETENNTVKLNKEKKEKTKCCLFSI